MKKLEDRERQALLNAFFACKNSVNASKNLIKDYSSELKDIKKMSTRYQVALSKGLTTIFSEEELKFILNIFSERDLRQCDYREALKRKISNYHKRIKNIRFHLEVEARVYKEKKEQFVNLGNVLFKLGVKIK